MMRRFSLAIWAWTRWRIDCQTPPDVKAMRDRLNTARKHHRPTRAIQNDLTAMRHAAMRKELGR